jgi:hypothetical protein
MTEMTRRTFTAGATAGLTVAALRPATALDPVRRGRRRSGPRMIRDTDRQWTALEQSHNLGGPFPAGAADGTVCFIRSTSSWQNGELIVFQMHANGNSYRHNGTSFEALSPGNWVHGPDLPGSHYSGISSVMKRDGRLFAFTHDEHLDAAGNNASVGVLESDLDGYVWTRLASDVVPGQLPQPTGFRGASVPCVVDVAGGSLVMFYTNRFGNGRHNEVWWATANQPAGPWTAHGAAIVESGTHYFARDATVVWSEQNRKWMIIYSTDKATRYAFSDDLVDWSNPRTFLRKQSEWQQTDGWRRWYGCLLDETQDSSARVGKFPVLSEHWIHTNNVQRFPVLSDVRIRN